jgi:aminopeptidase
MDERVREHAAVLVDWSARVEPGDDVIVAFEQDAHDLAVATAGKLGQVGANVVLVNGSSEVLRAYLRAHDGEFEADPEYQLSLYEHADVWLSLGGGRNATAMADVDGETREAYAKARKGVSEARLDTRWVKTLHPTRSLAQQAGMSYEGYREFVYDAVVRDWAALADEMGG